MNSKYILVTGGAGYIGSHTIIELVQAGYEVVSVDDFSNSKKEIFKKIRKITGKTIKNYNIDLSDSLQVKSKLIIKKPIYAVIHFAAKKSVPESVADPLVYYKNNIQSLVNILDFCKRKNISNFIFSSSCSVYGDIQKSPVSEKSPVGKTLSPYAETKKMAERIIEDYTLSYNSKSVILRYFNPAGVHPSLLIGDSGSGQNQGVTPILVKSILRNTTFSIFGDTYKTRDGTAVRDYVHVSDIAYAHVLALRNFSLKSNFDIINLGAGKGVTVLELVSAFERLLKMKINYKILPKRYGDIASVYASNNKAKRVLGWKPKYTLRDIIETSYSWEKKNNE